MSYICNVNNRITTCYVNMQICFCKDVLVCAVNDVPVFVLVLFAVKFILDMFFVVKSLFLDGAFNGCYWYVPARFIVKNYFRLVSIARNSFIGYQQLCMCILIKGQIEYTVSLMIQAGVIDYVLNVVESFSYRSIIKAW